MRKPSFIILSVVSIFYILGYAIIADVSYAYSYIDENNPPYVTAQDDRLDPISLTQLADQPLMVDAVLNSSAMHFPAILEALAKRNAIRGDITAADGAFDLVFSADGFDRVSGFWTGRVVNTELRQNIRPLGANVYGGYRVSSGTFPIYEDVNFTNSAGEAKIGVLFSLLRDRNIDDRRFRTKDTRLALEQADLDVMLTKIGVQQKALIAYWRWVTAGHQLAVYEELLVLAEDRQKALAEEVRKGARARIFLTENQQNILRRQRLIVEAQQQFFTASNHLSFYLRGPTGATLIPERRHVPRVENLMDDTVNSEGTIGGEPVSHALAKRPEIGILRTSLERARHRIALGENNLKPRLDLRAEVSRDFGEVAQGGISRDSTDTIIGFRFSVPFQQRQARGKLRAEQAKYEALRQRQRLMRDQIEIEIQNILIDLSVSDKLAKIAQGEVAQSLLMQDAEQQRFARGASDVFLTNIREETAADARIRALLAGLQVRIARANYSAALVDLEALGLNETALY